MFTLNGEWVIISRVKLADKLKNILTSLRLRIVILVLAAGLVPSFIISKSILGNYEDRNISLKITDIQSQCNILINQLESGGYLTDQSSDAINTEIAQLANVFNGRILIVNKSLFIIKDSYGLDNGKSLISDVAVKALRGEGQTTVNKDGGYIEFTAPIHNVHDEDPVGAIIVSVNTGALDNNAELVRHRANLVMLCIEGCLLLLGIILAEILARPIKRISSTLETSVNSFDTPVQNISTYSEANGIINSVDKTLSRMRMLDETRQEFVSNVSHELKTPITSMKVLADSLIGQEDIPVEIYKEFMEDIAQEIDRENRIIEELLSLVRLDKKAALSIKSTNINELVELLMKRIRPIAQERNIELVMESYRPVFAEIDGGKLGLAFSNLIENAVKYNVENGWVRVSLNSDHRYMFLQVSDGGKGIPKEEQEHIFERFYRGDKSHSREISGTGLGLAITRNAVALHHGVIEVDSDIGRGATFTVKIPLHYVEGGMS